MARYLLTHSVAEYAELSPSLTSWDNEVERWCLNAILIHPSAGTVSMPGRGRLGLRVERMYDCYL